jgi:hypothetical protein
MTKLRILILAILVLAVGSTLLNLSGCGGTGGSSPPPPPPGKIKHVVVIFQENRTPDVRGLIMFTDWYREVPPPPIFVKSWI